MAILTRRASDVRINEVDLSAQLTGTSTASAAEVITSAMGPITPTLYTSAEDFLFDFGNPNAAVSFGVYCGLDYLREGNSLWAVRAVHSDYKYAASVVKLNSVGATITAGITSGITDPKNPEWAAYTSVGDTALYMISSNRGPGSYGNNVSVQIDSQNLPAPTLVLPITSSSTGGNLTPSTYEYAVSAIGPNGAETLASSRAGIVIAGVSTTSTVTISWNLVPGAIGYKVYGRTPGVDGSGITNARLIAQVGGAVFSYTDVGASVNASVLPIDNSSHLAAPSTIFTLKVFDSTVSLYNPVETYTCSVDERTDDTGAQMEITQRVNPYSRYIRVESNVHTLISTPVVLSATKSALAGGASGSAVTAADITAQWDLFFNKEQYQIDVLINGGDTSVIVQRYMDYIAQTRNDCYALLDAPAAQQKAQQVIDYRNLELNLNSSYSALLAQDLLESDPISGKLLFVPPSGAVAGLQARVFSTGQPWFSIAGLNRGQYTGRVLDIRYRYTDGEATAVYNANISYSRNFAGRGITFWEQNTLLNKSSGLQFISIRVLANIIKRAAYNYLIYGLQEQNDDILARQTKFALESYLSIVQASRGISKYQVVISSVNNPAALKNSGILAVAIIITPIIPVREIQLTLGISAEGVTVTEQTIASL
jgi:Phage tail sheath protein subtilisin-like domain